MKGKSFQKKYDKLFLVTEDVYNRLLNCITDRTEQEEINNLNDTESFESDKMNGTDSRPEDVLNSKANDKKVQDFESGSVDLVNSDLSQKDVATVEQVQNNENIEKDLDESASALDNDTGTPTNTSKTKNVIDTCENQTGPPLTSALKTVSTRDVYNEMINMKKTKAKRFKCHISFKDLASNFSKKRHVRNQHKEVEKGKPAIPFPNSNSELSHKRIAKAAIRKSDDVSELPKKIIKRQAGKRKSIDNLSDLTGKRIRLSQGVKRKSEQEDFLKNKKARFRDWIPNN